jgi:hypothetical protein
MYSWYPYWLFAVCELEFWLEVWDFRYRMAPPPCSNNLLCDCQRRNCPYRQVSTYTFWRKLKAMEDDYTLEGEY